LISLVNARIYLGLGDLDEKTYQYLLLKTGADKKPPKLDYVEDKVVPWIGLYPVDGPPQLSWIAENLPVELVVQFAVEPISSTKEKLHPRTSTNSYFKDSFHSVLIVGVSERVKQVGHVKLYSQKVKTINMMPGESEIEREWYDVWKYLPTMKEAFRCRSYKAIPVAQVAA